MKNLLLSTFLVLLLCSCKKEAEPQKCWICTQTIDKFEGTKHTTTKSEQELCTEIAKNFFEDKKTFTQDYGLYKEYSIAKCTLKP